LLNFIILKLIEKTIFKDNICGVYMIRLLKLKRTLKKQVRVCKYFIQNLQVKMIYFRKKWIRYLFYNIMQMSIIIQVSRQWNTEHCDIWLFKPQVDSKIHAKRSRTSSGTYILILFAKTRTGSDNTQKRRKKRTKCKSFPPYWSE
jgi:hypothetical protein